MKNYEGRLAGILGTIIFHLIAAIVFMSFQLHSVSQVENDAFLIEFEPVTSGEEEKELIELPLQSIEKILEGDQEMLNIARNLANKPDVNIDPDDYIDKVKEEMIKNGQLGEDNYIDEQKRAAEKDNEIPELSPMADENDNDEPDESELMAANYSGPTRIWYDLEGRNHTHLPIPIYKCEGSGKVTLTITVNQKGEVETAKVIGSESTTIEVCLIETAVRTALVSKFNADVNAPRIQQGTLTYLFVSQ